ncbi:putative yir3 protein [Plasmodium yoelii yoelii]|uniref:Yir3 protein n=1 Tax=Plasmodium yoelii yoelii TaxID=73239 RepID=Q7R7G1_PLAYO|nr:putative yir3 protein [Plasmodium yoelii yoelii]
MNVEVCRNFLLVKTKFPDELSNGEYQFKDEHFKKYCTNGCNNPLEKINAGCLYFFDEFFGTSSVFQSVAKNNINIVDYIIIWLSYMLSLKKNQSNEILSYFYKIYINGGNKYKTPITGVDGYYSNYNDIINKKIDLTKVDMRIISKLYDAFITLCNMYSDYNENTSNCTKCSQKAIKFVEQYEELKKDSTITNNNSYNQLLSTLLNDYNNLKNICSDTSSFPLIEKAQTSEVISSSSIANNLLIVLSIFGAISIFLGISYKVNNKELRNYFHYIYAKVNKKIIRLSFLY